MAVGNLPVLESDDIRIAELTKTATALVSLAALGRYRLSEK